MLAVISNQHLTKNNIRRKAGKCKPRIPPHPTMKQGILFLRRMGYPAQKMMKKTEYKKGYEAGYHNGAKDCQKLYSKILDYICSMFQKKKRTKKKNAKGRLTDVKKNKK